MRTAALQQAGPYDPRLPHSADLDMWLKTALHWDVGRVNGPDQALYRVHDTNMHLTAYSGWVLDLRERQATFDILYDEHAKDLPDVRSLRATTNRRLAREAAMRATDAERSGESAIATELLQFGESIDPGLRGTRAWRRATTPGKAPRPPARSDSLPRRQEIT